VLICVLTILQHKNVKLVNLRHWICTYAEMMITIYEFKYDVNAYLWFTNF